ncbi:TolB family protein [Kitasatospora sp. NPDC089509]|uniref:TolB family protein n=1 Tax=Kitasatospora sp. NPDC089509 TaxID=3364079 RepID=UPI00380D77A0
MTRITGTQQSPSGKARTRASAGAGLLLLGTLLTGCGAEPGDIPLSEIRPESPTATPDPTPTATPGVVGAANAQAHNGLIVSRAYTDAARTTSAIVTLGPDGTGRHQVTQPTARVLDDRPDWSPDGSAIAFDRTDPQNGTARVWTVSTDGDNAHQISQLCDTSSATTDCANEDERAPAFSPDGKQLAFSRSWGALDAAHNNQVQYSDLYLMSPDGTSVQRLTFLTNDKPYSGAVSNPSWSPDGKQLTFEYRTSATGQPANSRAVYVVGVDGTGLRQLTPWELRAGDRAAWSPDGTQILFTTYPAGPDNAPGGGIYTVHPDGSAIGALTPAPSTVFYGTAAYAPDGTSIVFAQAPAGSGADLYSMRPDGTGVARLTNSADQWLSRPVWGTAAVPAAAQAPQSEAPSEAPSDAPSDAPAAAAPSAPAPSGGPSAPASAGGTPADAQGQPKTDDTQLPDDDDN